MELTKQMIGKFSNQKILQNKQTELLTSQINIRISEEADREHKPRIIMEFRTYSYMDFSCIRESIPDHI